MSKAVRNILSVLIILVTFFCVVICLGMALAAKDNIYYDLVYDHPVKIKEVNTEKIGKSYRDQSSQDGKTYYNLDIVLENMSNSYIEKYPTSYTMEVYTGEKAAAGYVDRVKDNGILAYSDSYLIPAGEKGHVHAVIEVPDEAEIMYVYEWEHEDDKFEVELKE